jgi:hypothetical protein
MKIQDKILQFAERATKKDRLKFVLLVCITHRLFYFLILNPFKFFYTPDTITYFVPGSILHGDIDLLRTPVYPAFINLLEFIFGNKLIASIVIFQNIFSLASIIPFYSILNRLFTNKGLVFLITLFYGCSGTLIDQCGNINPEGICLAASTFYLWILYNYFENGNGKKTAAFLAGFAPVLLVMLKPTYLAIPFLLALLIPNLALFKIRPLKKSDWYFSGGVLSCLLIIWMYGQSYKRQHGEFALTKVTDINNFSNIILSGGYKYGGDKEFIDIIDTSKSKGYYYSTFLIINEIFDYNKKCEKRYSKYLPLDDEMSRGAVIFRTKDYPTARVSQFIRKSSLSPVHKRFLLGKILTIFRMYWDIALVMLLNTIFFLMAYMKKSSINSFSVFCVLFVFSQFITLAIAGIYNWERVFIPTHSFIVIIAGLVVDSFLRIRYRTEQQP